MIECVLATRGTADVLVVSRQDFPQVGAVKVSGYNKRSLLAVSPDYKPAPRSCESDITLLNNLNKFFARFEEQNTTCPQKTPPPSHDQPLCLSAVSVKRTLSAINTLESSGSRQHPCLDPYQFAYRAKRSTDDAICSALHPALTHLDKKDSYVRMLFIDFSSAFNTIIPQQLICKLDKLGLSTSLCNWLLDFLSQRPQAGTPQGCVLSPLLFTLLTHDCTPTHSSNHLVKFADDTTLVGLITKGDETHYRKEVQLLTRWCKDNNLLLNVSKTKEIVVSFQRGHTQHHPLTIDGAAVERVSSTKFLGVHISDDLSWTTNTASLAKKAQQRLYFLRKLKRASAPPPIMTTFYRGTIESILTSCITVWGGSYTVHNRKALQRIVRTAERIIGVPLPSLQDLYTTRLTRKAITIVNDASHPAHSLFSLLPSGKRYRSLRSRTTRLTNSFIHQAVRLLNSLPSPLPAPARRSTRLGGGV
ncbi:hypothetical protein L3Q82_019099 [Scortum barcoo]|uniref:Uncharacterized protein n=1 Tax=Scortum barcoo TaxID=214431 RepID=A0ACB8VJ79_9TELE|nr:hypothetical protein L3Q82_019099 [Scortum barcoo]